MSTMRNIYLLLLALLGLAACRVEITTDLLPTAAPTAPALPTSPAAATATDAGTERTPAPIAADYPRAPTDLTQAPVVKIVDGDTIDVRIDGEVERVRLIGIDTPETVDPRRPVGCFGKEASERTRALLEGQTVRLEPDPSQDNRDRSGRLLRFVWLDDGRLVNLDLIAEGYAYEYTFNLPYKYQAEFRSAEQAARDAERGLWSPATCGGQADRAATPTAIGGTEPGAEGCPPERPIKGNINRDGERIYHAPDSPSYGGVIPERCFASAAEAEAAGFRAPRR